MSRPLHINYLPIPISFFSNDTATTEIYTLSLHDALPISHAPFTASTNVFRRCQEIALRENTLLTTQDRKSTRLNSSHVSISYAVFCLKKKKKVLIRR